MNSHITKIDGLYWHRFAIYYASKEWYRILPEITKYMEECVDVYYYIFIFSYSRGENIKLMLASSSLQPKEFGDNINKFLVKLVGTYPSTILPQIKYGEEMWAHYTANTIIRNDFVLPRDIIQPQELCRLGQLQSQLLACIIDEKDSGGDGFSIALFLCMNLLRTCNQQDIAELVENIEYKATENNQTEMDLLDSYWDYTFSEEEKVIEIQLLKEIKKKYAVVGIHKGFHNMSVLIKMQVGIMDIAPIVGLLKLWCKNKFIH